MDFDGMVVIKTPPEAVNPGWVFRLDKAGELPRTRRFVECLVPLATVEKVCPSLASSSEAGALIGVVLGEVARALRSLGSDER